MKKTLLTLCLLSGALYGVPQESAAVQEMRLSMEQLKQQIHSQGVEIGLFQERAASLEKTLGSLKQELKASPSDKLLERRISTLEKANETLIADLKTLRTHINDTSTSVSQCQTQLTKIDKQLTSDIQSLKSSMQSMLALLQGSSGSESRTYTVQSGDSLGQIALIHKTDIKTLKKLNNLSSDVIYSGQKIILP